MRFLGRRVPDCLVALFDLRFVVLCYLPWHEGNQGVSADIRGLFEYSFVKILFHDLPYGHLRQRARVDFLHLVLLYFASLSQGRLQADFNEEVV